jgi:hypothetical protein
MYHAALLINRLCPYVVVLTLDVTCPLASALQTSGENGKGGSVRSRL